MGHVFQAEYWAQKHNDGDIGALSLFSLSVVPLHT